jgi:CheY-like chemotaxis protein
VGTQFQVELPFELEEPLSPEAQSIRLNMPDHKKKKILVVDDNVLNRELTLHVLTSWDFEVDVAESGIKALGRLQRHDYDLVLMDIQMPDMDGYQTTQTIRNDLKMTLPVVALTAHSNASERTKCIDAGMNEYVS